MNRKSSGSGLLLMELLVSVAVFAICTAVCMKLFTAAKLKTDESFALSCAVTEVSSACELFRGCGGDMEKFSELSGAEAGAGEWVIAYDGDWQRTDGEAEFSVTVKPLPAADGMLLAEVSAEGDGGGIFTLVASCAGGVK